MLEYNCCVWNFNITKAEENDIERVQKVACKIILQRSYTSYEEALNILGLENLKERRSRLCLKFAKRCLKYEKKNVCSHLILQTLMILDPMKNSK